MTTDGMTLFSAATRRLVFEPFVPIGSDSTGFFGEKTANPTLLGDCVRCFTPNPWRGFLAPKVTQLRHRSIKICVLNLDISWAPAGHASVDPRTVNHHGKT